MAYRKSGETRERILKAAARLFSERGYYETGIGDIAREAGIGRASFYYHFTDKEKAARAVFDTYVEGIYAAAERVVPKSDANASAEELRRPLLLSVFVEYILLFRFIALNKATHAVYYDLVNFADYDRENIDRLKRTTFKDTVFLASLYGRRLTEAELVAFIVTTNAAAKSIFKAVSTGILDFDLYEASDYFFRHAVLPDIPIPEPEYRNLLIQAFSLCESVDLS
ncbi:MAG TPA: helix-turn-helix domain-containing protein [Spirochaetia bacterium]|nr:helix-turn-helix domain-containing protein [Spirochaetales bacterium]HRY80521.1 helix-turn-helix domain-containing protein [Spirochaetia bacterium]HRZ89555.1 helix-turn-helix domain-containing protein [Spirochaetia bacterium]